MKEHMPIYNENGHSNEEIEKCPNCISGLQMGMLPEQLKHCLICQGSGVVPPVARRVSELTPSYIQQAHDDLILKIVSVIWHWDVVKLLHLGVELINREEREAGE